MRKRESMSRRRVYLLFFLVTLSITFLPQAHAFAIGNEPTILSVQCSENGCNGTDPYVTGCAETKRTVATTTLLSIVNGQRIGRVELQYSDACGTNWAEVYEEKVFNHDTMYDEWIHARIERAAGPDGEALSYDAYYWQYTWVNTDQVYAYHNQTRALGRSYMYRYEDFVKLRATNWV